MSQAKVDAKKELKKNRQQLVKKEKIRRAVSITITSLICAAVVFWIGFSAYKRIDAYIDANTPMEYNDVDITAIEDYLDTLNQQ